MYVNNFKNGTYCHGFHHFKGFNETRKMTQIKFVFNEQTKMVAVNVNVLKIAIKEIAASPNLTCYLRIVSGKRSYINKSLFGGLSESEGNLNFVNIIDQLG